MSTVTYSVSVSPENAFYFQVPYLQCEPPIRDIKMLKDFFDSGRRLAIPNKAPEMFRVIITVCQYSY